MTDGIETRARTGDVDVVYESMIEQTGSVGRVCIYFLPRSDARYIYNIFVVLSTWIV